MSTPRTMLEVLTELEQVLARSETPRQSSLFVLGYTTGLALRHGWSTAELVAAGLELSDIDRRAGIHFGERG